MKKYQIAQLNIATLLSPNDSPLLSDFVSNIDRIDFAYTFEAIVPSISYPALGLTMYKYKTALMVSSTMLVTTLLLLAFYVWIFLNEWGSYQDLSQDRFEKITSKVESEMDVLWGLHNRFFDSERCTQELLSAMRETEFHLVWLKDIGFVIEGNLLCSTRLGNLKEPLTLMPFYIGSEEEGVFYKENADVAGSKGHSKESVLLVGSFQAYLKIQTLLENFSWIRHLTYSVVNDQNMKTSGGITYPVTSLSHSADEKRWYKSNYYYSQRCHNDVSCTVAEIDIYKYFQSFPETAIALIVFLVLFNISAVFSVLTVYQKYNSLPRQIKRGLNKKQIICHYQPLLDLSTERFGSVEVLSRWSTLDGELIPPDEFIPYIESNLQTSDFTQVMFEKSISEIKEAGLWGKIRIAINVFPNDLESGFIAQMIDEFLNEDEKSLVTIELIEQKFSNIGLIFSEIQKIRAKGSKVAIDDFGTGYSNFEYLQELDVDILKIDKSFIQGIEENSLKSELVGSIVNISKILNLSIVAEGVELPEQLSLIKKLEVDYSQGYYHSKPLPISELSRFLRD